MRIATFNVFSGKTMSDPDVDADRFSGAISALDTDVLALQEVDRDQPRSGDLDLTALATQAMGSQAHRFQPTLAGTPGTKWRRASQDEQPGTPLYGIALLSRYPVQWWRTIHLPWVRGRVPAWLSEDRRVAIVHEEPRVALVARVITPLGPLTVAGTHLSYVPGLNAMHLRRLRHALRKVDGPVLLVGDLNLPGNWPTRLTGYRSLGGAPTYPTDAPTRQIDHALLRGAFPKPTACAAVELPMSDHRALVMQW